MPKSDPLSIGERFPYMGWHKQWTGTPAVPIHCHVDLPGAVDGFIIPGGNGSEERPKPHQGNHESASFERE